MILVVLLYALLALTFPLAQYALQYANPLILITLRMLVGGMCLLGYYVYRGNRCVIQPADRMLFFKLSLFHIYLAFIPEFWSLQYLPSLKVTILYCTTPLISAVLEFVLFKKRLEKHKIIAISIGMLGMVPLMLCSSYNCALVLPCSYPLLPEIALMFSIVSATYAWFIVTELMQKGYNLIFINGVAMFGGGLLSFGTSLCTQQAFILVPNILPFLLFTGLLILISNVIVYNLYGMLLQRYSITFLSLAGFLSPIFGALYTSFLFQDRLSWHYYVSVIVLFLALRVYYHKEN